MHVLYGFDDLPPMRNPVATIGSYDGVHAGHRALLGRVVRFAKECGGESVVITFAPHPRTVTGTEKERAELKLLTTLDEKIFLLGQLGIDRLIVVPFTEAFSRIAPDDFVRDCLVGRLGIRMLVVGYDHRFGRNKEGDFGALGRLGGEFGFEIHEVEEQGVDAGRVNSTAIRASIAVGDMARAARMLGGPYAVIAVPDGRGSFVSGDRHKLLPPAGIYRVRAAAEVGKNEMLSASKFQSSAEGGGAAHELRIGADGTMQLDPPAEGTGGILVAFS